MGRTGDWVEIRDSSIRLRFMFEGTFQRKTLMLNGSAMAPTAANVKYAGRLAEEIKDKIKHDRFSMAEYFPASGSGGALTVGTQLDTWLAAQRIEVSTKQGYSSAIRFWKSHPANAKALLMVGDLALRALKTSHVMTAIASRSDLSGKTINNYVQVLREAVELAVTDNILMENPVVKVPAASHQAELADPFTREEAEKIIAHMQTKWPGQVENFVEFWLYTGLRTSELFALTWGQIDLASKQMMIDRALVRGVAKKTKTNEARLVELNSRAMAALQRQHTQMAGDRIFQDPRYDQDWIDERAFRRSFWAPTLKALGIRYRRPYNCRHTYATMMLMAGMRPAFCASQLGHSVETFHRHYAQRWINGASNDLEMARLENALIAPGLPQKRIKDS
jgi:integrase